MASEQLSKYDFPDVFRGDTVRDLVLNMEDGNNDPVDLTWYNIILTIRKWARIVKELGLGDWISISGNSVTVSIGIIPIDWALSYDMQFDNWSAKTTFLAGWINVLKDLTKR